MTIKKTRECAVCGQGFRSWEKVFMTEWLDWVHLRCVKKYYEALNAISIR